MKITTTVFREISFQLTQGNPWWGLLLANEYIEQSNPLRAAFVSRFKQRIGADAPIGRGTLANALIRGKTGRSLSAAQRAAVGARVVRKTLSVDRAVTRSCEVVRARSFYSIRSGSSSTLRLAVRQRSAHVARFSATSRSCSSSNFSYSAVRRIKSVGSSL